MIWHLSTYSRYGYIENIVQSFDEGNRFNKSLGLNQVTASAQLFVL